MTPHTEEKKMKKVICQYCGGDTEWVENKEVYGRNYGKSYMIYLCRPCDAFVGCHNNTKEPKGYVLANKELRAWRRKAHAFIDPIWQSGKLARGQVYDRLKNAIGYEVHVHIVMGVSHLNRVRERGA